MIRAPDLHKGAGRHLQRDGLAQYDARLYREVGASRALPGHFRLCRSELIIQPVANGQRAHRQMLFPYVAVHGSLAAHFRRHLHRIGRGRLNRCAVFLVHTHKVDAGCLVGGGVGEAEHAELPRRALGLHAQNDVGRGLAGSIGVHPDAAVHVFEDVRLVAVGIDRDGSGHLRRCW